MSISIIDEMQIREILFDYNYQKYFIESLKFYTSEIQQLYIYINCEKITPLDNYCNGYGGLLFGIKKIDKGVYPFVLNIGM